METAMRYLVAVMSALISAGALAQGSQDFLTNTFSTNADTRFWAEVRERDKALARQQQSYRDAARTSWEQKETAVPMTPQRARMEEIGDQLNATGKASAADLTEVGMDLYFGNGLPRMADRGLEFIKLAADDKPFNWHYAQLVLGDIYWNGQGMKADKAEGLVWYRKSAGNGNVIAMSKLVQNLAVGAGVPKDLVEAAHWADALEAKLWEAPSPSTGTLAAPTPGEAFADDEQRSTAAFLIAAVSASGEHDRARALYWMERAGRWGCKECAKLMSTVDYSSAGLPSERHELELALLGVRIAVPPYRGQWAAGAFDLQGKVRQGLRLDPGTPAGKMFATLEPEGGSDCGTPMLKLELGERMPPMSLPALDPNATLFTGWYLFALESAPGSYILCRDLPTGYMLVTLVAADPNEPQSWVKLAFDQARPIVDDIVSAMSH
jgi:Sel1 repeat